MQPYRPPFAQRHPLMMPVLALGSGMLAYALLPLGAWIALTALGTGGLALVVVRKSSGLWTAIPLLLAFAGLGGTLQRNVRLHPAPELAARLSTPQQATLAGQAGMGEKLPGGKYALRLHVDAVALEGHWQRVEAVVNLRVPSDHYPEPGTRLAVTGFYVPNLPEEGDPLWQGYRESLARQDVAGAVFATTPHSRWHALEQPRAWDIRAYAQRAAFRLNGLLDAALGANAESAVGKALLLGTRETLTEDLRRSYASAGAIHLLVVSGGHLAILWGILFWLLKRLPPQCQGTGRWLGRAVLILCLWGFAFLTGLGPSIVRAAVMLTLVQVGMALGRPSTGLNALAAACLLMLLWDPLTIQAVGFQLSVACVAGILALAEPIEAWWQPSNKILRLFWKAFAITLAAQAGALPVTLYYFGQMPVWFWLANPPAVLLSEVLVWVMLPLLGLTALASGYPSLMVAVKPLAALVSGLLVCLNGWMEAISRLPGALQEGWKLPLGQVIVLGLLLVWLATVRRGIGLQHARYGVALAGLWCLAGCWDLRTAASQHRTAIGCEADGFYVARQIGLRLQGPDTEYVRRLGYAWGARCLEADTASLQAPALLAGDRLLVCSKAGMSTSLRRLARARRWQVVDLTRQSFYVLPQAQTVQ